MHMDISSHEQLNRFRCMQLSHAHLQVSIYICLQKRFVAMYICTRTHPCMHAYMYIQMHTCTHTQLYSCMRLYVCTHMQRYGHMHVHTYTDTQTDIHTYIHTYSYRYKHLSLSVYIHILICTYTSRQRIDAHIWLGSHAWPLAPQLKLRLAELQCSKGASPTEPGHPSKVCGGDYYCCSCYYCCCYCYLS